MDPIRYNDPYASLRKSVELRGDAAEPAQPAVANGARKAAPDAVALDPEKAGELAAIAQPKLDATKTPVAVSELAGDLDGVADGDVVDLGTLGSSLDFAAAIRDPLAKVPTSVARSGDVLNLLAEQARSAKGDRTSQVSYGTTEFLDDAALVVGTVATVVGGAAAGTAAASGAAVAGAGAAGYKATRWADEKTGAGDAVVDYMVEKDAEGEEPGRAAGPDPTDDPKNDKKVDETDKKEETGDKKTDDKKTDDKKTDDKKTDESGKKKTEESEESKQAEKAFAKWLAEQKAKEQAQKATDAGSSDSTQPLPEGVREEIAFDPVAFARHQSWVEGGLVQPGPEDGADLPDPDSLQSFDPHAGPRQGWAINWGPDGPPAGEPDGPLPEVIGVDDPPEGFGLGDPADEAR